jgi:hypothetical protein
MRQPQPHTHAKRGEERRLTEHRRLLLGLCLLSARVPSDLSRKGLRRSVEKLIEVLVRDDLVASVDEIDVVRLELEQVGGSSRVAEPLALEDSPYVWKRGAKWRGTGEVGKVEKGRSQLV